ncbi:hypothetical protein M404DRAFT_503434 [Pisolithus tinctorius Marx 270]|uniref:Uncharacterized protein n=1 Tax=Pisolithus tinctorius Marx 270 TaxID=870435 RepID=A0A0C3K869_PISTI|nr:hypothetical protein M404DRAFT_503434 [Pisolithus tinctorius Marx 270]
MLASPYPGTINDFRFPSLPPSSVLYDSRNKQTHNLESSLQRRERIEFLKKREWTRRVAELVKYSHIQQLNDVRNHRYPLSDLTSDSINSLLLAVPGLSPLSPCRTLATPTAHPTPPRFHFRWKKRNHTLFIALLPRPRPLHFFQVILNLPGLRHRSAPRWETYFQGTHLPTIADAAVQAPVPLAVAPLYPVFSRFLRKIKKLVRIFPSTTFIIKFFASF